MKPLLFLVLVLGLPAGWLFSQTPIILSANSDTTICMGTPAFLHASITDTVVRLTNTYTTTTIPHNPYPYAAATVLSTSLTDDQYYGPRPIGFNFCFFGQTYTQFWSGSNGWMSFQPLSSGTYDPWSLSAAQMLPNPDPARPRAAIMPCYRDWYPNGSNCIKYQTIGTAPNRKLILTYIVTPLFSCTSTTGTFQVVLHETTNIIDIHMMNVPTCPGWNSGLGIQGIQNAAGTVAYPIAGRNCTSWTATGQSLRFLPTGAVIPWNIYWYAGTSIVPIGAASATVTPATTTNYTCSLTVCNNPISDVVTVTVEPCGYLTTASTLINCAGYSTGTASVEVHDGLPPYTFTWSNGVYVPSTTLTSSSITGLSAGTYAVTVTTIGGAYVLDTAITVSENPPMQLQMTSTTPEACAGALNGTLAVQLTNGISPFIYSVSGLAPSSPTPMPTYTFAGLASGLHGVTVTDVNGCFVIGNYNVIQSPAMQINLSSTPASCVGALDGSIHAAVTNGTGPYIFNTSSAYAPSQYNMGNSTNFLGLPGGNYTIYAVDIFNCTVSNSVQVGELALTYNTNVNDVNCMSGSDGSVGIQITGGTPPFTYIWSIVAGNTPAINGLPAGDYQCTVTDSHGCRLIIPAQVSQPDSVMITTSSDTLMCKGETASLTAVATGGTPPYQFYWNSTAANATVMVSPPVTSTYVVYATDGNGCKSRTHTIVVTIYPNVSSQIYTATDSICRGDTTYLSANIWGGNGGPYHSTLNNGDVFFDPYPVWPETTTTYTLTARDQCGSPAGVSSVTVHVMNIPPSTILSDVVEGCAPLAVHFDDPTPPQGQTYLWLFEDAGANGYSVKKDPLYVFTNPGTWDVSITTRSPFGCFSQTILNDLVTVWPVPEAGFSVNTQTASILDPVILFTNQSQDNTKNLWLYGDGHFSDGVDAQHVYADPGEYFVHLIVENNFGCTDTLIRKIRINEDQTFYVPNAFNPDSPIEANRFFKVFGQGIQSDGFHLIVYDRWGMKTFESFSQDHAWNGRMADGEIGKPGSYSWILVYRDLHGMEHREVGWVDLIR